MTLLFCPIPTCPSRKRQPGFTLIELLVVISIIALLMGILLPALARGRDVAKASVCASNIRQLGMANLTYAQDNKTYLVRASVDIWSPNLQRWHGKRSDTYSPFDPTRGDLASYLSENGRIKQCPAFASGMDYLDEPGYGLGYEAGCGGYGYNGSYLGARNDLYYPSNEYSARLGEIRNPTQTIMFTDTAYVSTIDGRQTYIAYSFCEAPYWQFGPPAPSDMTADATIHFRHQRQTTVFWADGHTNRQSIAFSLNYLSHSMIDGEEAVQMGMGWFGPKDNSLFDLN